MVSIMYNPTSIYILHKGSVVDIEHSLHNILQFSFSFNFNLVSEHYTQKSFHRRLPLLLMDSTAAQSSSPLTANMPAAASSVLLANSSHM